MIGIYDSGFGGLSVLHAVRALLPAYDHRYLADSAHCPYGTRSTEEVRRRALACAGWLEEQGAQVVVVACNTASAAALELLRAELPVPIVGMEPGVKPAIAATRSGRIGVLATGGTLSSTRYQTLLERFAAGVRVLAVPAPHLVEQVEAGELDSYRTRELLAGYLAPLKAHRVDTIVLGCTHFNFLAPLIRELAGPGIAIIDTAPAVARQVALVVRQAGLAPGNSTVRAATTGDPAQVAPTFARMWHATLPLSFADC